MNHRRIVGRWVVVVRDIRLGRLRLGHTVHLEDGLLYRGPAIGFLPIPDSLRRLIGWWRPTAIGALNLGYSQAHLANAQTRSRLA